MESPSGEAWASHIYIMNQWSRYGKLKVSTIKTDMLITSHRTPTHIYSIRPGGETGKLIPGSVGWQILNQDGYHWPTVLLEAAKLISHAETEPAYHWATSVTSWRTARTRATRRTASSSSSPPTTGERSSPSSIPESRWECMSTSLSSPSLI